MIDLFKNKDKPERMVPQYSEEMTAVVKFIKDFQQHIDSLIGKLSFNKDSDEMLPPWIVRIYPLNIPHIENLDDTSPFVGRDYWYWRGGEGGDYRSQFIEYWSRLDLEAKKRYFSKYDLGREWPERKDWFFELFDNSSLVELTDDEWDAVADELLGNERKTNV